MLILRPPISISLFILWSWSVLISLSQTFRTVHRKKAEGVSRVLKKTKDAKTPIIQGGSHPAKSHPSLVYEMCNWGSWGYEASYTSEKNKRVSFFDTTDVNMLILLTDCHTFIVAIIGRIKSFLETSFWKCSVHVFSCIPIACTPEFLVALVFIRTFSPVWNSYSLQSRWITEKYFPMAVELHCGE